MFSVEVVISALVGGSMFAWVEGNCILSIGRILCSDVCFVTCVVSAP